MHGQQILIHPADVVDLLDIDHQPVAVCRSRPRGHDAAVVDEQPALIPVDAVQIERFPDKGKKRRIDEIQGVFQLLPDGDPHGRLPGRFQAALFPADRLPHLLDALDVPDVPAVGPVALVEEENDYLEAQHQRNGPEDHQAGEIEKTQTEDDHRQTHHHQQGGLHAGRDGPVVGTEIVPVKFSREQRGNKPQNRQYHQDIDVVVGHGDVVPLEPHRCRKGNDQKNVIDDKQVDGKAPFPDRDRPARLFLRDRAVSPLAHSIKNSVRHHLHNIEHNTGPVGQHS